MCLETTVVFRNKEILPTLVVRLAMFKTTCRLRQTASAIVATAVAHGQVDGQRRPLEKECHAPSSPRPRRACARPGVAVIDGVMDAPLVAAVRATEAYQGMPLRGPKGRPAASGRPGAADPSAQPGRRDPRSAACTGARRWTRGRAVFERVEKKIWPLVKDFSFDGDATDVFRSEMSCWKCDAGRHVAGVLSRTTTRAA